MHTNPAASPHLYLQLFDKNIHIKMEYFHDESVTQ